MSALPIAYRPANFDEMIGNEKIIKSLKSILTRNRQDVPHAFLLHGPSGSGKTTLARIIAKELGCPERIPGGGANNDYLELDVAQFTGIDTAREIRRTMFYSPARSKCRVWILDEFHNASSAFQDGMLKALEDAPDHVYFILCTTELKKIKNTIKTRCSSYQVRHLNEDEMEKLLNWVSTEEDFDISEVVKGAISTASKGCPRQALSILDQIIDLPDKEKLQLIKSIDISGIEVRDLCQALLKHAPWHEMVIALKGLKNEEPEGVRQAIVHYMKAVMLKNSKGGAIVNQAALVFDCFREPVFYTGHAGITAAAYSTLL